MRRRQIYAARQVVEDAVGPISIEIVEMPLPKGTCPNCGKHIGKGIAFHVKRCNGK